MSINSKAKFWRGRMDAWQASTVCSAFSGWLTRARGTGYFVPHSQVLLPICLFYVDVLRFSVGITK